MVRLTVLYNLPPGADEEAFLAWRLGEHQQNNASRPGVLRTDFAVVESAWPRGAKPRHRFVTIAEWPDREAFEASFYDPEALARFEENLKLLDDPVFLIGEVLASSEP
jgi:quinol monooxygenase YgiN